MTKEERILEATNHLEKVLAQLDQLTDEIHQDDSLQAGTWLNVLSLVALSKARKALSEQLDKLNNLGSIFATERERDETAEAIRRAEALGGGRRQRRIEI